MKNGIKSIINIFVIIIALISFWVLVFYLLERGKSLYSNFLKIILIIQFWNKIKISLHNYRNPYLKTNIIEVLLTRIRPVVVCPDINSPAQSFASVIKVPSKSCLPCRAAAFCSFCLGSLGANSGSLRQHRKAKTRHSSTTRRPATNVTILESTKHHHLRTRRHSSASPAPSPPSSAAPVTTTSAGDALTPSAPSTQDTIGHRSPRTLTASRARPSRDARCNDRLPIMAASHHAQPPPPQQQQTNNDRSTGTARTTHT